MKKIMIILILPILFVFLACNIPKTNAYTVVYEEEVSSQPYVSYTTPYDMTYKFVADDVGQNYHSRTFFLDSSKTFVLDSNGNIYNSVVRSNEGSELNYSLAFNDDAGYSGGMFSVMKSMENYLYADQSNGFVGYLSGALSSYDFLNFMNVYFIDYDSENIIDIDFSSILNITLSIPIDGDFNNTLTRTFNYNDSYESVGSTYHSYSLYNRYNDAYNEIADIVDTYEIEYLYFSFSISFDIVYYEYSGLFSDYIHVGEYVVIGDNYEINVNDYRSIFGGYVVEEVINPDFSSWLVTGIGAFMNLEIIPGWSIAVILSIMIGIPLLIYVLRLFFGG